ncbi:unnamed protein product, partial [Discosporangium mesarthrocarpum]
CTCVQNLWIHAANVGDCRAVLCRGGEAVELTWDHKTTRKDEAERIKEAGGEIRGPFFIER